MKERKNYLLTVIKELLAVKDEKHLKQFLKDTHPADIAEVLSQIETKADQQFLLAQLDSQLAALVLNELDAELVAEFLQEISEDRVSEILDEMSFDDAADFLGELSENEKEKFLELFEDQDAEDVQELMEYEEDTAGGIMTTEYVAIPDNITASKAIEVLRETAPDAETVYYVYVINMKNQLVGVISLRELIIANPNALISDIMRKKVISVNVNEDQEDVARLVSKYDFLAVPVVDDSQHLIGIITVDDIIDVIHEEATEDLYRLAGTYAAEEDETLARFTTALKSRLPWLLVTLLGGLMSGQVLKNFSDQLNAVVALAFFIPLLIGMGGNVGTQSSTVTIRGIATGQINTSTVVKTILRESMVGISLGTVMGSLVALTAFIWQGSMKIGLVVGLTMLANMFTAATMGSAVPIILKRIGVDPATASAPFITTTIDIVGLIIYATLATILLGIF
ncbi:MAG: magnesium transporter [Clostridia bacterium]|nr:magnesium transporter [Clostridia bacterium]MDN5321780.1 magnesium transporter [Clostridia bacterium]